MIPRPNRIQLVVAVCTLAALAGAFSAGRFSAPLKVETRDVEKIVERVVVQEKVVTVERDAKVETRIVWRERVIKEGVTTEREVEKTGAVTTAEKSADVERVVTRDVERLVTVEKIVTLRPSWRVGVMVGGSYQQPLLPIAGPLVVGASGEFRVIGGVWVGVWTLPQFGAVGGSVALEF